MLFPKLILNRLSKIQYRELQNSKILSTNEIYYFKLSDINKPFKEVLAVNIGTSDAVLIVNELTNQPLLKGTSLNVDVCVNDLRVRALGTLQINDIQIFYR